MTGRRAPFAVAALLLAAYVLTLAPSVTYWDSGEFLAAMKTLGIPHPPGTPLYVLVGNVWSTILGPLLGFAFAVNLFSAISTAIACGILAYLMLRWTSDAWAAAAGGILAGLMSSVWLNANETEVYAPALLLSALLLLVADNARLTGEKKWIILLAYLSGLAWSLQLSALVAAPAALVLALSFSPANRKSVLRFLPGIVLVAALGASAVLFMLVRAPHDPGVNQGNPATWNAFMDVITRSQYQPVATLPRQAPWYIQIGNLLEYADWQVALGLGHEAPPSWLRTPFTIVYAILGVIGAAWHRRVHRPSWRAMLVLFVTATIGVIAYLNMKASPSYGYGFLPLGAKHEARERDYFFALAFVCWGLWAGAGAVTTFMRSERRGKYAGLVVAALPFALNFRAVDRSAEPTAMAALDSARRILVRAPPRAVVFAYGDNDTYPVWFAQHVDGTRRDVTMVTMPLLGARWYRSELGRRDGLLSGDYIGAWRGIDATLAAICQSAEKQGRPVVAAQVRGRPPFPEACSRASAAGIGRGPDRIRPTVP